MDALNNRGVMLRDLGRHQAALQSYDAALSINPKDVIVLNNRGNTLRDLGRHQAALESFDAALKINPKSVGTLNSRGNTLRDLGRHQEALQSYEAALSIDPKFVYALNGRGYTLWDLGRHQEASKNFEAAFSIEQKDEYLRGATLCGLKRYKEALASLEKALNMNPMDTYVWSYRGDALRGLKAYADALKSYEKALSISPAFIRALNGSGDVLCDLGRYVNAIESYETALKLAPENKTALNGHKIASLQLAAQNDKDCLAFLSNTKGLTVELLLSQMVPIKKSVFEMVSQKRSPEVFSALLEKIGPQSALSLWPKDNLLVIGDSPLQSLINLGIWVNYLLAHNQAIPATELILEATPESVDETTSNLLLKSLTTIGQTFSRLTIRCPLSSTFESLLSQAAAKTNGQCAFQTIVTHPKDEKSSPKLCSAALLNRLIAQIADGHELKASEESKDSKGSKAPAERKAFPLTIRLLNGSFVPGMVCAHSSLEELDLTNNALSKEAVQTLQEPLTLCPRLHSLRLDQTNFSSTIQSWVALFSQLKGLKSLSGQSQKWTEESWKTFLQYLASNPDLAQLDLRHSALSNAQIGQLTKTIQHFNLQLVECQMDGMPQELTALLKRNQQKETLEKAWQSAKELWESNQKKLSEIKNGSIPVTESDLQKTEREMLQALKSLHALENQSYPLLRDRRKRVADYRGDLANLVEAWGVLARQQKSVDKVRHLHRFTFQLLQKYAPQNPLLLEKLYASYIQTLLQWRKSSEQPFYHFEMALYVSSEARQAHVPAATEWAKDGYRRYLASLTQAVEAAKEEKVALDFTLKALRLLREAKSGQLAFDRRENMHAQLAQALSRRPIKSIELLRQASSIAEQAEKARETQAYETLEILHDARVRELNRLALGAKDFKTALPYAQALLLEMQTTKLQNYRHRLKNSDLCQETLLSLVERYDKTDGQEEAIMDLLESVRPSKQMKERLKTVTFPCCQRYAEAMIREDLKQEGGSFAQTVSDFLQKLSQFQSDLNRLTSQEELVKAVQTFLEKSQAQYSRWYWRKVFERLQKILNTFKRLAAHVENEEKSTASASTEPSAPLESELKPSTENDHPSQGVQEVKKESKESKESKDLKESKESKKSSSSTIPERPKRETIRDHLDYLKQLKFDMERLDIPSEFIDHSFYSNLMVEPVVAADGYTYDKSSLLKYFEMNANPNSPRLGIKLKNKDTISNMDLQNRIIAFLDKIIAKRLEEMGKPAQAPDGIASLSSSYSFLQLFSTSSSTTSVPATASSYQASSIPSLSSSSSSLFSSYPPNQASDSPSLMVRSSGISSHASFCTSSATASCEPTAPLPTLLSMTDSSSSPSSSSTLSETTCPPTAPEMDPNTPTNTSSSPSSSSITQEVHKPEKKGM